MGSRISVDSVETLIEETQLVVSERMIWNIAWKT